MRNYIEATGKTEEAAIQNALDQLGMDRDDVSVEILERAKAGFLGLGSCPARVKVSYGEEEPEPAVPAVKKEKAPKAAEKKPEKKAEKEPKKSETKAEPPSRKDWKKEPRKEPAPPKAVSAAMGDEVDDAKAREIKKFLSGLLEQLEVAAEIRVYLPENGRYKVILEGQGLGAVIGRRGETLDAIQQLTSYAVNREGGRVRVQLDAENYRAKREQSLEHLAKKVAAKVVKYRRSVTLEPMNAYERHVVHTALQDVPGVTTYSTGVDPNRRVIVACDRGEK